MSVSNQTPRVHGAGGDEAIIKVIEFGGSMKSQFPFAKEWTNLNHGSFGTTPNAVCAKLREYQDMADARPDSFFFYDYYALLDASRAAVTELVNAPVETVVLVSNATEGVNTVFRNLHWTEDGKDVILFFSTAYEATAKTADYIVDYHGADKVSIREISLTYPLEDAEIIDQFRRAVAEVKAQGKRARLCVMDVVSSRPGVRFPWEDMCEACRELGVQSVVDGAQGVGMVKLDLSATDPDFFVTNCHKWLFAPRPTALLYVPVRNQHLLPTTLATSHGYVPKNVKRTTPLAARTATKQSVFESNFASVGTRDMSAMLAIKDAIAWRRDVCGGEDRIRGYLHDLNKRGIKRVAELLQTEVLDNQSNTLTNCAMGNVALPLWVGEQEGKDGVIVLREDESVKAFEWIKAAMIRDYDTFIMLYRMGNRYWVRLSAQVYLDMHDYEFAAKTIQALCNRVGKREFSKKEQTE